MARSQLDTAAFDAALRRELSKMDAEAGRAVRQVGSMAAETAKANAPRDSGEMADSITAEHGRDHEGPFTDVTVGPFYSSFVEFGTSRVPARPFMRPAVQSAIRLLKRQG